MVNTNNPYMRFLFVINLSSYFRRIVAFYPLAKPYGTEILMETRTLLSLCHYVEGFFFFLYVLNRAIRARSNVRIKF